MPSLPAALVFILLCFAPDRAAATGLPDRASAGENAENKFTRGHDGALAGATTTPATRDKWDTHARPNATSAPAIHPAADRPPHVVFLVGEGEYRTAETVPAWAKAELEPRGVSCTFLIDDMKSEPDFPALEQLDKADALFVSLRRRGLPAAQLAAIRKFADSGKPVLGIRTASHAFAPKQLTAGRAEWKTFDRDVFGGTYQNHYGKGPATLARIEPKHAKHPILTGLPAGELRFASHLYRCRDLLPTTSVMLRGKLEGNAEADEPLAWTNVSEHRRAFYTSLGAPEDFESPAFRRLLLNATLWALGRPIPAAGAGVAFATRESR